MKQLTSFTFSHKELSLISDALADYTCGMEKWVNENPLATHQAKTLSELRVLNTEIEEHLFQRFLFKKQFHE